MRIFILFLQVIQIHSDKWAVPRPGPRIGEDIDIIHSNHLKLFYVSTCMYTMIPYLPRAILQAKT